MEPVRTVVTVKRKCGLRKEHGVYIVSPEPAPGGQLAVFVPLTPPIPYPVKFHRAGRIVDGTALLERRPMSEWWEGSSKQTEAEKSIAEIELELFGMSTKKRLAIGECVGANTGDEALAILVSKVKWDNNLLRYFRDLTIHNIQNIKYLDAEYNKLHVSFDAYIRHHKVGNLMDALAVLWRMVHYVPPRKRQVFIPTVARMMILMGVPQDAKAAMTLLERK